MSYRKLSDTTRDYFTYSSLESDNRKDSWRQRGSFSFSANNYEADKSSSSTSTTSTSYFTYSQPTKTSFEDDVKKKRRGLLSMNRNTKSMEDNRNGFNKMTSILPPSKLTMCSSNGRWQMDEVFQEISPIISHLYLCGVYAITAEKLRYLGIQLIVSLMRDSSAITALITNGNGVKVKSKLNGHTPSNPRPDQLTIAVDDCESTNLVSRFPEILPRMHYHISRGNSVLVHCAAGVSRSSTVVLAYLMTYHGMTLTQAFSLVRSRRSCVQPNSSFWAQLVTYEKTTNCSTSNTTTKS